MEKCAITNPYRRVPRSLGVRPNRVLRPGFAYSVKVKCLDRFRPMEPWGPGAVGGRGHGAGNADQIRLAVRQNGHRIR